MFAEQSKRDQDQRLNAAIRRESKEFADCYRWLQEGMPPNFFQEVGDENVMLITHSLMGFPVQDYFSIINLKNAAIALCLDSADADIRILKHFALYGIKSYRTYVSTIPLPYQEGAKNLRIATIRFTQAVERQEKALPEELIENLRKRVKRRNPHLLDSEFDNLMNRMDSQFLSMQTPEQQAIAIEMFLRAQSRDLCQYEVTYNEYWMHPETEEPNCSMHIMLAWKNTPKHHFLYLLAKTIHRHRLVIKGVNAAYILPNDKDNILLMSLGLHGANGQDVWEVADIPDFLREMITIKYFSRFDIIDEKLVEPGIIKGSMGNLLRAMSTFIHQALVPIDSHVYTPENIMRDLCRFPELTKKICEAFSQKFNPEKANTHLFQRMRKEILQDIDKLDTGHEENDVRRKNILRLAINFVHHTLKTNYYRYNYSSLSFRLDPTYLSELPIDRKKYFPELPYAIFFIKGMHFFGFHIRFRDLARGGLRTVYPEQSERMQLECDHVFQECYNLAYTQHRKNKEIPEGGAKGIIFMEPYERLESETKTLKKELELAKVSPAEIKTVLSSFKGEQKVEYMHQAQRSFVGSLLSIINYKHDGSLLAHHIVDYWRQPENIYLGPDENMHPSSIEWIARHAKRMGYMPGSSFITSKPRIGINHKEYGVTSSGVHVYLQEMLKYLEIDPLSESFTIKMAGGPDGDVAGNQICNLAHSYPETAKILALRDGTGTIYDPEGLDLPTLVKLFHEVKGVRHYPPDLLHEGGFIVDLFTVRNQTPFIQQTLSWQKKGEAVVEEWLSGSETNHLYRRSMHSVVTDVFIPAGGRPLTLNRQNYREFLTPEGKPSSRTIIEGANLYFDDRARRELEKLGVLIIKDSSANKAGVICSSYECLCGLAIGDETFAELKNQLVEEIMRSVQEKARREATLLLETHKMTGEYLTDISEAISEKINLYTYELLDYLEGVKLSTDPEDPLLQIFISYCPPTLQYLYRDELIANINDQHKKAIIACAMGTDAVYTKGLNWSPTIVDILPLLLG